MTDLGSLLIGGNSRAYDINNLGQVVGSSGHPGFLWQDGVMTDLNDLIPPGAGWDIRVARAINDSGQIAGYGYVDLGQGDRTHAFVMTPVPEPATIIGLSGAVLLLMRKRMCRDGGQLA